MYVSNTRRKILQIPKSDWNVNQKFYKFQINLKAKTNRKEKE
jgi:hypothetical protein